MKYQVTHYYTSYIEFEVDARSANEARDQGNALLEFMDDAEYTRQLVDHADANGQDVEMKEG